MGHIGCDDNNPPLTMKQQDPILMNPAEYRFISVNNTQLDILGSSNQYVTQKIQWLSGASAIYMIYVTLWHWYAITYYGIMWT